MWDTRQALFTIKMKKIFEKSFVSRGNSTKASFLIVSLEYVAVTWINFNNKAFEWLAIAFLTTIDQLCS